MATQASLPTEAMPKDATQLMMLVIKRNGLDTPGLRPWHLAATYRIFDNDKKPREQGTFEMWWAAPDSYKVSMASPSFKQTRYQTTDGSYFVGAQTWAPYPESAVERELINPVPEISQSPAPQFLTRAAEDGEKSIQCLRELSTQNTPPMLQMPAYCVSNDGPAVRVKSSFRGRTTYDDIVLFDGQYVARKIRIDRNTFPVLHIQVTKLEPAPSSLDDDLRPPSTAVLAPARKPDPAPDSIVTGKKLPCNIPVRLRNEATHLLVHGSVSVAVNVSKDGEVTDAEVVSGPEPLWPIALEIAKTCRFEPSFLDGEPVEIHTSTVGFF
jgi:hypothetical protein